MPKPVTMEKEVNGKTKVTTVKKKIVYTTPDVFFFYANKHDKKAKGEITEEIAKKLVGWREETKDGEFGDNYTLTDLEGNRIRCVHLLKNRFYFPGLSHDWMLEILRRKWQFNLETIIIDRVGDVQDGQHRLVGLILACQEWRKNKERWQENWPKAPTMASLVAVGCDESDEVVNSIGVGRPRSLADVFFRSEIFAKKPRAKRMQAAKMAQYTVRLLWKRTGADVIAEKAYVPKRPHSEMIDFVKRHPRIEECVSTIQDLDKGKNIARFIPPGYAAGLLYLMGCSNSAQDKYDETNDESGLDWKNWNKAVTFWKSLAKDASELKPLTSLLVSIDATGSLGLGEKCGAAVKAWNLFVDGEKLTKDQLEVLLTTNEYDQPMLAEFPVIGGIDVGENRKPLD